MVSHSAGGLFAPAAIRSSSAPQAQAANGPLPSLRLDPSAHLLEVLSSAKQLPDGSFEFRGTLPRSVIVVAVESVYFQCPKALVRSDLWNPDKHVARKSLPSTGTIIGDISAGRLGGEQYDREYPERLRKTLY